MFATDNSRFIAAIRSRPDDDAPRLIYADWLEEQGDVRGELIRLQCRLARLQPGDPIRESLLVVEGKLSNECKNRWIELSGIRDVNGVHFRRGFVHTLAMPAESFAKQIERIFKTAPLLQSVALAAPANWLSEIVAKTQMQNLAELHLFGAIDTGDVYALSRSLAMASLSSLSLNRSELGQRGMRELGRSTIFHTLQKLEIHYDDIRDDGVAELAGCRAFPNLKTLELIHCWIESPGVRLLAEAPRLSKLRSLNLRSNLINDEGVASLALHHQTSRLRNLGLAANEIGDEGASIVVRSPHLEAIETLDLQQNAITANVQRQLRERFAERVILDE